MRLTVETAPAAEPISTSEAKAFLRVDGSADDTLIGTLITAARRAVERCTGRSLITQTRRFYIDAHEGAPPLRLPFGPVQSIGSFVTYNEDGSTSTVTSSNYYLSDDRVVLSEVDGSDWPTYDRYFEAAYVEYDAGYGDAADVPEDLVLAVKQLVAHYYDKRLDPGEMKPGVKTLLYPYINYIHGATV